MNKMVRYKGSQAQAGQESFALNMNNWVQNGFYVEVGAFDPFITSNTYILETEFNWRGFGIEILPECVANFHTRSNPCLCKDATITNYKALFEKYNAPKQINYLQLDIEPADNTLEALKKMPLDEYRFSVITFEHDAYQDPDGARVQKEARGILESYEYQLVVENLQHEWRAFEDWYVDPSVVDESIWGPIVSSNIDSRDLFIGRD